MKVEIKKGTNEIWKPIKDYDGFYQVSNFGRVKSLKKGAGRETYLPMP